jgi:chromate transporter
LNFKVLLQLFLVFFKIGAFTFGGGYAMLPLIQKEITEKQKWMKEEEILDIFAISQSVPGVISINSAIFIGRRVAGVWGAVFSALGIILPSFVIILIIAAVLVSYRQNPVIDKVFTGIRAASAALILLAAIKMGKKAITNKLGIAIAVISFALVVLADIHALWAVILGAVCGIGSHLYKERKKP